MKFNIGISPCLVLAAGLLCSYPVAHAADPAGKADREGAVRQRLQEVAKELNLTDEQKEKLRPLLQEEMKKLRALREDTTLDRRARAEKVKAIREELTPKVKAILTPEQYEKWQKMREERRREGGKAKGKN